MPRRIPESGTNSGSRDNNYRQNERGGVQRQSERGGGRNEERYQKRYDNKDSVRDRPRNEERESGKNDRGPRHQGRGRVDRHQGGHDDWHQGGRDDRGRGNRRQGRRDDGIDQWRRQSRPERTQEQEVWGEEVEKERDKGKDPSERQKKTTLMKGQTPSEEDWEKDAIDTPSSIHPSNNRRSAGISDRTANTTTNHTGSLFISRDSGDGGGSKEVFTSKVFSLSNQTNKLIVKDALPERRRVYGRGRGRVAPSVKPKDPGGLNTNTTSSSNSTRITNNVTSEAVSDTSQGTPPRDENSKSERVASQVLEGDGGKDGGLVGGKPKRYSSQRQKGGETDESNSGSSGMGLLDTPGKKIIVYCIE